MNRITGKIFLEKTGVGIPNLLVTVYDVDLNTLPEEALEPDRVSRMSSFWGQLQGDRLGAVATGQDGSFELEYEDDEFRIRNQEKRPDLMLFVTAPEGRGLEACSPVLHLACGIRQNAGRTESYLIQLATEQLEQAGVPVPSSSAEEREEPEVVIQRLVDAEEWKAEIDEGVLREVTRRRVDRARALTADFEHSFKPMLLEALSQAPEKLVDPESFVAPGESVLKKNSAIIKRGIENTINRTEPKAGLITLTDKQKKKLEEQLDENGSITGEELEEILSEDRRDRQSTASIFRENPLVQFCREKTQDEMCAQINIGWGEEESQQGSAEGEPPDLENLEASGSDVDIAPEGSDANDLADLDDAEAGVNDADIATEGDVPRYIARLMETVTSPEEVVAFGLEPATLDTVGENVKAFSLENSPADTPAFYDFYNLQIAFEHVWQEAIDQGVLKLSEDAFKEIVKVGGNPCADPYSVIPGAVVDVIGCFEQETAHSEGATLEDPPVEVVGAFDVTKEQWNALKKDEYHNKLIGMSAYLNTRLEDPEMRALYRRTGERILQYADSLIEAGSGPFNRLHQILRELNQCIKEDYAFTIFAPDSVNFGILVTYRQRWDPEGCQAGDLVETIPLAPKEIRKYSKKEIIKRKRSEKEVENSLHSRKEEASETSRAEEQIIRKALAKTNFSLTSQGAYDIAIAEGTATTSFSKDASKTSDEVKKAFHEAVWKSAQEYKQERKLEVMTEETEELEFVESGEISNPNDEIPVTFLFYELQRRFRMTEEIHRLTPVILVAQDVPWPHEIDEAWLITHDWILRRVMLDDSFIPALNYLSTKIVGDEVAVKELRKNVEQQRRLVDRLKEELVAIREQVGRSYMAFQRAIEQRAGIVGGEDGLLEDAERLGKAIITGGLSEVAGFLGLGGGQDEGELEAARIRQEAAQDAFDRAVSEERELRSRLEREVTALNAITETYTKMLSEHLNRKAQVVRLRAHVKQNILFYMQAIWSHEPPDQRFFRLHDVPVPILRAKKTFMFSGLSGSEVAVLASAPHQGLPLYGNIPAEAYGFEVHTTIEANTDGDSDFDFTTLEQVADLDNLLGFKGNYMIFPLKESNALTDFMMDPYVDRGLNQLIDPDDSGNWTLQDFARYVCCLKEELTEEQFEEIKEQLKEQYQQLLMKPHRNGEIIYIPTGSLYIEQLPGKYSNLEEFKRKHRAIDVKKVQAEVREMELGNVLRVARLLAAEDDHALLDDPDIESVKKVIVSGNGIPPNIDVGDDS